MKIIALPALLLVLCCIISSCSHTIVCSKDYTILFRGILSYDTTVKQRVKVVRYEAGSNFTKPVDSTERDVGRGYFYQVTEGSKEYRIIVLPQNRVHTLKNIHYGNEKRKGSPGLSSEQCTASITFTFDDKVYKQPYHVGSSTGYLPENFL